LFKPFDAEIPLSQSLKVKSNRITAQQFFALKGQELKQELSSSVID